MDARRWLDPEVRDALALVPPLGPLTAEVLPAIRAARMADLDRMELSDAVERSEVSVAGPPGGSEVTLRLHRPRGVAGTLGCIYWMHGGGYVLGSARAEDLRFDRWCRDLGCLGVAVEYRLSPEDPYPAALEDCYAGLRWVHEQAAELGVDGARVGIGGASAGGGLAAALALVARDRGEVPVAFQALVYPMLDDRRTTVSSGWDVPVWPPASNAFGWSCYLGGLAGEDVPAYAAPARAQDVGRLPSTFLMVGALDGFVDEDLDYARRLNAAGVAVEAHLYPGAPHGFELFAPGTRIARQARRDLAEWLARALAA